MSVPASRMYAAMALGLAGSWTGMSGVAQAQVEPSWTVTRLFTTETPRPGGEGTLSDFSPYSVMIDTQQAVFAGFTSGIYRWMNGQVSVIVDTSTPLPGFKGTFTDFGMPFIEGNSVYFSGGGDVDGVFRMGVYRVDAAGVHVVVDTRTPGPSGVGNFTDFSGAPAGNFGSMSVTASNGRVAFAGAEPDRLGVYIWNPDGSIEPVLTSLDPLPGFSASSRVRNVWWPTLDGDDITFASFLPQSMFARIDGTLQAFARPNSPAPDGGTFGGGFGSPAMYRGNVLFWGPTSNGSGIYRFDGTSISTVFNHTTPVPGESGPVSSVGGFAFDRGRAAVTVDGVEGSVLFAQVNNAFRRVIDAGAPIDGREVDDIYIEVFSFEHRTLVFTVFFTDGGKAVYRAEPACDADWNFDAVVNSQDFFDFLVAFFDSQADFNEDDATNSQDFFDFLTAFFTGC